MCQEMTLFYNDMNIDLFDASFVRSGRRRICEGWSHEAFVSRKLSSLSLSDAVILSSRGWIDGKLSGGIIDSDGRYWKTKTGILTVHLMNLNNILTINT